MIAFTNYSLSTMAAGIAILSGLSVSGGDSFVSTASGFGQQREPQQAKALIDGPAIVKVLQSGQPEALDKVLGNPVSIEKLDGMFVTYAHRYESKNGPIVIAVIDDKMTKLKSIAIRFETLHIDGYQHALQLAGFNSEGAKTADRTISGTTVTLIGGNLNGIKLADVIQGKGGIEGPAVQHGRDGIKLTYTHPWRTTAGRSIPSTLTFER